MMMMEREIKGKEMIRKIRYYFVVKVGGKVVRKVMHENSGANKNVN